MKILKDFWNEPNKIFIATIIILFITLILKIINTINGNY
jgi:hypothetical protein